MKKKSLRVFISYANADSASAARLRSKLSATPGLRVFDVSMITAAGNWQSRLREYIEKADVFLLLATPNAMQSPMVLQELGGAWGLRKPIVAIAEDREAIRTLPIDMADVRVVSLGEIETADQAIEILAPYQDALAS